MILLTISPSKFEAAVFLEPDMDSFCMKNGNLNLSFFYARGVAIISTRKTYLFKVKFQIVIVNISSKTF